uniref:Zinc carboxypeptidase A 1 n=1 Tax=Mayetiola destructor TaxID=39758 RepID=Q0QWG6_MAYDE|nr:carboxypeptidase A [Mayetiola destructor]
MTRTELLCLIIYFASTTCENVRFDNYRVYRIWIQNLGHLEILQELENYQDGLSFLEAPFPSSETVEIVVPPHHFEHLTELFEKYEMKFVIKISNLQSLIDNEQPKVFASEATFGWKKYHDLTEIYEWLDEILEKFPVLSNYNFGTSYEGRPMRAVKISHKANNPTIFIESTIHGREWITAATATYLLNELLTSTEPEVIELAQNFDWVFVPVFNVDGYAYTHHHNRIWRKTRQPNANLDICIGVDLNRNFDFNHLSQGSSKNPCSAIYAGPEPFSTPEALALSEFVKSFDNLKMYLSFQSYRQRLLFPYGTLLWEHTENYKDLNQIAHKAKEAISQRFGTEYSVGSAAEADHEASGTSIDWVHAKLNVSLAFAILFRDKGEAGFILPSNQIIPNALETFDGLKAMLKEAQILNYF